MSLLAKVIDRLFHTSERYATPPRDWGNAVDADTHQAPPVQRTAMAPPTDVVLLLTRRAEQEGLGDEWRRSLDGLLTLLNIDRSPAAQRQLAQELNLDAGEPGSARHDAVLYEALIQRLSENGVVAPESFYK